MPGALGPQPHLWQFASSCSAVNAVCLVYSDAWGFYAMGLVFAVVGLWVIWQPKDLLSWLTQHSKGVNMNDPVQQRFVRFVGGGLVLFGAVLLLGLVMSR
jgi:hypothetical protein